MRASCRLAFCLAVLAGSTVASAAPTRDADALAARIDKALAAKWAAAKVDPAGDADDAEFLRRVYLDLSGCVPPVSEVRAFLDDRDPRKRRKVVDKLLDGPGYVAHFANVWRAAWLPEGGVNVDNAGLRASFEAWLRIRLAENAPYDRLAREILTADAPQVRGAFPGDIPFTPAPGSATPIAFALALENKPENLAGNTSRLFLGARLECAQCHNHPFADWTREQFWQYAAFFTPAAPGKRPQASIPGLNKTVQAAFLDGTAPDMKKYPQARASLAAWATSRENPYFARAGVNRVWQHLFGVGLAEPVDDIAKEAKDNPLLDELAAAFAEAEFDLKHLTRALVLTKAYQLSSRAADPASGDEKLFARMPARGLSVEQVVASLLEATGHRGSAGSAQLRRELAGAFARQSGKSVDFQTSIPQALALMNGRFTADETSPERSGTLAAVAASPFLDPAGRVETLYLAALGRKPTPTEAAKMTKYVETGGPSGDPDKALADVFWALLNSSEFALNH